MNVQRELKRKFSLSLEDLLVFALLSMVLGVVSGIVYGNVLWWLFLLFLVYVGYRLVLRIRDGEIK